VRIILILICTVLAACQPLPGMVTVPPATATSTLPPAATETSTLPPPTKETPSPVATSTIPDSVVELAGAEVSPGFSLIRFADLYRPTGITFVHSGQMYVTSQDGNVYLLNDEDKDGRADSRISFAVGYNLPLGVAVHPSSGEVYLSYQGAIAVLSDSDADGRADQEMILVDDLPVGNHQNDNPEFGPDGWLYIGVGSACDACEDSDPRSASILRFNVGTGESEIFATGLRNPYDIAFHPETGDLFATDNGRDDLGMEAPFEELNHIVQGGDYGYPHCWNEHDQPGCEDALPPVVFFEAHSSANGVDICGGQDFPPEYYGNAFVTIFGSWLKPGVQTGIQRVVFSPDGNTYSGESSWFVRFPEGIMPLPLVFGPDGALYVGDFINDTIYRISYGIP
jgi:glucose/arabinose dehydrogenase